MIKNQFQDWARSGGGTDNDGGRGGSDTVRGGQMQHIFWRARQHGLRKIINNKLRRKEGSRMILTFDSYLEYQSLFLEG